MKGVIMLIVICIVVFFYFVFLSFTPVGIIENDGYAITGNIITETLFREKLDSNHKTVEVVKVNAFDQLYSGQGKLFVGERKKTSINPTYPVFTNENLAIVNLSNDSVLIDSKFRSYEGYKDFTLTLGQLYNKDDKTRADDNDYLFLKLSNSLFINSNVIKINTFTEEYQLGVNCIINFSDDVIKYYSFSSDVLVYNEVVGVDENTKISILGDTYNYKQLLLNLKLIEPPKEEIPDIVPPEETTPPPSEPVKEVVYQKPAVSCKEFQPNVYSALSTLSIYDPSEKITSSVVFEFKANGKVYLRKSFNSSGIFEIVGLSPSTEFEIRGYYNYLNEEGKEIERTFFEQSIKTKGIDSLSPLTISFENGEIYSSILEIKDLKITEGLDSETIKGIKKLTVKINGNPFKLNGTDLNKLLRGESINYSSPKNLQSNTIVDYEVIMSDSYGNDAVVKNNVGRTRTSKKEPCVSIKVVENTVSKVAIKVNLENEDDVALNNYRYVVVSNDNNIVSNGLILESGLIELSSLNSNDVFSIKVYSNYDTGDGKGLKNDQLLGETKFTSVPITSLGYVRLNLTLDSLQQSNANISISLDSISTNNKLIELLKKLNIEIYEKIDDREKVVYSSYVTGNSLEQLKTGQTVLELISNLKSTSTYYIRIYSIVAQGDKDYNLETLINIKSFTTLKNEAQVVVRNTFSTENLIDFDVKVIDIDGAIQSKNVRLEVRDAANKIVRVEKININDGYVRLTYDKLIANKNYTFNYIAEEYNVGKDNSTFEDNHIISTYRIYTEVGINGDIYVVSLLEKQLGKNLFNINNTLRWKSNGAVDSEKFIDIENGTITLTSLNGYKNNSYYLIDYASKKLTISFYAKLIEGEAPVYIANSDGDATTYLLSGLTEEYKKYTYTFTLNANGYVGFNIRETSGKNLRTTIMIKELQIEDAAAATNYQPFVSSSTYQAIMNINLNDTRDEIITDDYYVNVYREGVLVDTHKYDIDITNSVINDLKYYDLNKKSTYQLDLVVKIRDREYVIDTTTFTTEKEIRSIKTITEFFRMHNNGRYVVTADLDFRNNSSTYGAGFYGDIDFQGHRVIMATQNGASYLFHTIASTGKVKNVDLHIYMNNIIERGSYYGLNYQNLGSIENIMVTLEESTNVRNVIIGTTSYVNYGVISNFVVNSKVSLNGERFLSLFVIHNYGIIKNGYIYGEDINATFSNQTASTKRVGALAGYTGNNSQIRNVFSLVNVNSSAEGSNDRQVGLLIGESNRGLIQNSYAIGEVNIDNNSGDLNVGYVSSLVSPTNLFYVSNKIYNSNYSQRISKLAINDNDFQDKVLNGEGAFVVDELVSNGYYPQVIWPSCMPYQELIPLIEVENSDLIDITSTEVLESNVDSARVLFNIHNPSAENIINISIKDASVRIVSQEHSKGKTRLIGIVENPIKYLSKYYVKAITSLSAFGISYTRNYADNERALYFDLYRRVGTINDWKNIRQSPSENYQLVADLDFMYATDFLVGNFSGKLNGGNHTIRNIEVTTGNGLFTTLSGEIKNLNVVNYKKKNAVAYGGLIYNSSGVSVIDNVHMTNVTINATTHIGGIIGYGSGTIIKNSSVTNFKNSNAEALIDLRIGSIAGYISAGYIQNTYAQDIKIDITDSISTYGVGGIVGQIDGGLIENCYAVGSIKTNSSSTGGIAGLANANISNVYTNVNIESSLDYIGGIVGQASNNYLYNSLVVGDLYSSYSTTNLHRTVGNVAPNQNNYALRSQLINGYESTDFYGDILVSYDELLFNSTYDISIKMGSYFDYSKITQGFLPKLYNMDGVTILPNQVDNPLPNQQFSIISVDAFKRMNDAIILVNFNNPNNFDIDGIEFDYFDVVNVNKIATQNGVTTIEVVIEPNRALDSYKLSKIIYSDNGVVKEFPKSVKIDLQFYKNIGSFEDWQNIDSKVAENYRLVADLDFQGRVNINMNVVLARLEGIDDGYTIRNLIINKNLTSQALIKIITTNLENVNFDNITITNNRTSGNYNNIITFSYADIKNVNFSNITIDAPKMSYAAPIGFNRGYYVSNINLEHIYIKGLNYSAGFIGYTLPNGYNDITASDITVVGQNYTGGVIGYKPYIASSRFFTFNVSDVNVSGVNYVGGVFGMGTSDNSAIDNSVVTGTSYVGGFSGYSYSLYTRNVTVTNCHTTGSGSYIGGIFGYGQYYLYNIYLFDSTVTGTLESTTYVGGLLGHSGGYGLYDSGILNSTVTSNGNYVGGIAGIQNDKSLYYSFVYNTTVTGLNNVGGVVGITQIGLVAYLSVNAYVTANGTNAGGIYGYIANAISTNASYPIRAYYNIIAGGSVTAQSNVGGLAGTAEVPLYSGHFYSDIIATTLITTNPLGSTTPAIGNNKAYNSLINNMLVYNNMKINDVAVSLIPDNGLTTANYVTLANLKVQTTYTNKGFSTSRYDYTSLVNNKFPLLKASTGVVVPNQVPLDLPSEVVGTSLMLKAFEVHELPNVNVYTVDIDKINIEFEKVDQYSSFNIKLGDKEIGPYKINKRTFTFSYDYKTDFDIVIFDEFNEQTEKIDHNELAKLVSVFGYGYYYYKDNMIKSNFGNIDGDFVNLYLNKALDKDGNIYQLPDKKLIGTVDSLYLLEGITPLYDFTYNNYVIKTYYNYSEIIDKDGKSLIHDDQYLIKNGKLEIISSSLKSIKNSVIIDNYGGNSYQTVLGNNGVLYNLKSDIKVPNDFVNNNIKYFNNNLLTSSSFILVYYEDGSVYGFDYRTGQKLFSEKVKSDISVAQYIKEKLSSVEDVIDNDTKDEYNNLRVLEDTLKKYPIEKALLGNVDEKENNNYVSKYDADGGRFVIYDEKDLFESDSNNIISIPDKIILDNKLIEFYFGSNYLLKSYNETNGLNLIISILGAIIISLFLYFRNIRDVKEKNKTLG